MKSAHFPLTRLAILFFCFNLFYFTTYSQVGIGNTDPAASSLLDIRDLNNDKGILVPRVDIANLNTAAPVTSPEESLLVYNTNTTTGPGFFYWNSARWVGIDGGNDWSLTGNAGTAPGVNFLGTTDNQALQIHTNNVERARFLSNGQIVVNNPNPFSGMVFNSFATGGDYAIAGAAVNGVGVFAQASGNGDGVNGLVSGSGDGVYGQNTGNGYGVHGLSNFSTSFGIKATHLNNAGTALFAVGANWGAGTYLAATGVSVNGDHGVFSWGKLSNGTGVIAAGNNSGNIVVNANGGGVAGSGTRNGVFGYAGNGDRNNANRGNSAGVFLLDTDNNIGNNTGVNNNGIRAAAIIAGYDNVSPDGSLLVADSYYGGYFSGGIVRSLGAAPSYAYVGIRYNTNNNGNTGTDFKIIGNGTNSTLINDIQGNPRIMFSPESPEIVFQDYGVGHLVDGEARILLDPILKHSLHIDEQHPLKVFVTLEGDCNGVYVTNKSADGFTVKELQNGRSSVPFSWQIVANRADTKDESGNVVSKHVGLRLPIGPGPITAEAKQLEVKTLDKKDSLKEQKESSTGKELNMSVGDKEKPNTTEVQGNTSKGEANSPNTISEISNTRE